MPARHPCLRNARSRVESRDLLLRLDFTIRPERAIRRLKPNLFLLQRARKTQRKIGGCQDPPDAEMFQKRRNHLGIGRLFLLGALHLLFDSGIAYHIIHLCLTTSAIHLQITKQDRRSPGLLDKSKGVRRAEARGIQHVRRDLAGSNNQSCAFHNAALCASSAFLSHTFSQLGMKFCRVRVEGSAAE